LIEAKSHAFLPGQAFGPLFSGIPFSVKIIEKDK
jgi:hypothetical protein